jgi:hypothetical protein
MQWPNAQTLLFLFLAAWFIGDAHSLSTAHAAESDGPRLSKTAVKELQIRALENDGRAALRLSADPHLGRKEQMYWARISAEDGFPPGIYPLNRVRARYWLKLAKVRGVRLADFGLCLVNRKDDPALPVCQLPPGTVEIH